MDQKLKFLIFRLDFNEFYKQDREKQRGNLDFDQFNLSGQEYDDDDYESEEEESEEEDDNSRGDVPPDF